MNPDDIKQIQDRIQALDDRISKIQSSPSLVDHYHNGFDVSRVNFSDIYQKRIWVHHTIQGTAAATAANYGVFWMAPVACYLSSFKEVHQTAGTDGGTVSLTMEKLTSGVALDSGVVMLSAALSLKAAINVPQSGTITTTLANKNLAVGDRIAMKDAGVLTTVANVTVLLELLVI